MTKRPVRGPRAAATRSFNAAALGFQQLAAILKGAEPVGNLSLPSQNAIQHWIGAAAEKAPGAERRDPDRVGKWLIRRTTPEIDAVWAKIEAATRRGRLGPSAKVSTLMGAIGRDTHVVCVYTKDADDRADLVRVLQALRRLGIVERLDYKTDEATRRGIEEFAWSSEDFEASGAAVPKTGAGRARRRTPGAQRKQTRS